MYSSYNAEFTFVNIASLGMQWHVKCFMPFTNGFNFAQNWLAENWEITTGLMLGQSTASNTSQFTNYLLYAHTYSDFYAVTHAWK